MSPAANNARVAPFTALALLPVWLAFSLCSPGWSYADEPVADPARRGLREPSSITICVVPLGRHDSELLDTAMRGIRYVYGFSVKELPGHAMPKKAFYKPRKRYRAEKLIDYINDKVKVDACFAVIGFTRLDISTTKGKIKDWGILGLGEVGGTAAVVSSYRLTRRVERRKARMRTIKVVNHELGHVLGLDHYDDEAGCVMNDARGTVKTVDEEKGLLCRPSRAFLQETHGIALPVLEQFDWREVLGD